MKGIRPIVGRLCSKGATLDLTTLQDDAGVASGTAHRQEPAAAARRLGRSARSRGGSLRRHHPRAWPGRRGVLRVRAIADRGLLRLQQAGPRPGRHQQHRFQLAAVHVLGGGRLQAHARRRRAALLLRRHRSRRLRPDRRRQPGVRAPHRLPPGDGCQGRQPGPEADRHRSAASPTRPPLPICIWPSSRARTPSCSAPCSTC